MERLTEERSELGNRGIVSFAHAKRHSKDIG